MKRGESTGTIPSINENTKIDVKRWARRFDRAKNNGGLSPSYSAEVAAAAANEALVDDDGGEEEVRRRLRELKGEPVRNLCQCGVAVDDGPACSQPSTGCLVDAAPTAAMAEEEPVYSSPRRKPRQGPPSPPPLPPPQSNGTLRAAATNSDFSSDFSSSDSSGNDAAGAMNTSSSPLHRMEHREHHFVPNFRYHVPTLTKPTPAPADKGKKKLSTVQLIPEEFYAAQAVG